MRKRYLLIAGDNLYPQSGTKDWRGRFETREEIEDKIFKVEHCSYFSKGKNKGEIESVYYTYNYDGRVFEWYEIVDLDSEYNTLYSDDEDDEE